MNYLQKLLLLRLELIGYLAEGFEIIILSNRYKTLGDFIGIKLSQNYTDNSLDMNFYIVYTASIPLGTRRYL